MAQTLITDRETDTGRQFGSIKVLKKQFLGRAIRPVVVKCIRAKEKQASAKQTFGFHARITSKRPMKSGKECESTSLRVTKYSCKRKASVCEADIWFSCTNNEQTPDEIGQGVRKHEFASNKVFVQKKSKRLRSRHLVFMHE